jgi:hypothetical protein
VGEWLAMSEQEAKMSKDAERVAREIVKEFCTEIDDHDYPQENCKKCKQIAERIRTALNEARKATLREVVVMLQGVQTDAINLVDRGNIIDRVELLGREGERKP